MLTRRRLRVIFLLLVLVPSLALTNSYLAYQSSAGEAQVDNQDSQPIQTGVEANASFTTASNITVVTTSPRATSEADLLAFNQQGGVIYANSSLDRYFDVDPVEGTRATVSYVGQTQLNESDCPAPPKYCRLNVVETANLSTGETNRVFSRVTQAYWHDVDFINDSHLLVADNANDQVSIINYQTGLTTWSWNARTDINITDGGRYPGDWTHMNDVNLLDDGRVMVSLRNNDRVVFIDRQTGLQENWTLGKEDDYSILYEQHNPDYINQSQGGPAVVVADSEHNLLTEFQREGGEWKRTWIWQDNHLQWPRDADRLPNGNTLVVDSNGNRIFEINRQGEKVWSVNVDTPYDVERLGTGPESVGGESATALNLTSKGMAPKEVSKEEPDEETNATTTAESKQSKTLSAQVWTAIRSPVPNKVVNGVTFIMPPWVHGKHFFAIAFMLGTMMVWGATELWWSPLRLSMSWDPEN